MSTEVDQSADDMVAEADTGARAPAIAWQAQLIIGTCIAWSLFQLYIASKLPGVLAQSTGVSMFANIVAQARFVHLAFAIMLATLAFPLFKSSPRTRNTEVSSPGGSGRRWAESRAIRPRAVSAAGGV